MSTFFSWIAKTVSIPLLKELGVWLLKVIKRWIDEAKVKKEIDQKIKELKRANKTPEEIRDILRDIAP